MNRTMANKLHCQLHDRINKVIIIIFQGFDSFCSAYTCLGHNQVNIFGFNAGLVNFAIFFCIMFVGVFLLEPAPTAPATASP